MLYVFLGSDSKKVRAQSAKFVESLRTKKPNSTFAAFDDENFSMDQIGELLVSRGLFDANVITLLNKILNNKEVESFILEKAAQLAESKNVFILIEEDLSKGTLKTLKKYASKLWQFDKQVFKKSKEYSLFGLSDAVGSRDRKKAWVLLQEAIMNGEVSGNIHGILFWQIKNMLSVKNAETKGREALFSLKLNPFVLKKALSFSKKYSRLELRAASSNLIHMYHRAHLGEADLETEIERFVLRI